MVSSVEVHWYWVLSAAGAISFGTGIAGEKAKLMVVFPRLESGNSSITIL